MVTWNLRQLRFPALPARYQASYFFYLEPSLASCKREIFNWLWRAIWGRFWSALCHSLNCPENSRTFSTNQIQKWNQSRMVTRVFPRFGHLLDFCLRSHWLLWYFPLFWLVVVITLVLMLRHSVEIRFTLKRFTGNYFGRAFSDVGYDLKSLSGRIF